MYKTKQGITLNLSKAKEIAAGGEGKIFEHPTNKKKVVKIYHTPRKDIFAKHLETLSHLNGDAFVKPQEIYYTLKGEVAGFDMDYVDFNDYWLFNNMFNKGFCTSNNITSDFKLNVLSLLRGNLEELHKNQIVIGDLNMYNIFVSKKGNILFVDVDSYQTSTQPHSGVLLDEIRDWTTLAINDKTDIWAYDILAFWTTTYCHPFKWVVPGNKETLEQRVKANKSYLSSIQGIKIPALYQPPTGETEKQFRDIFSGRRYFVDFQGVHVPTNVQIQQTVSSTALEIREVSNNVTHVYVASDFISVRQNSGIWYLIETKSPKITRQVSQYDTDILYPSDKYFATVDSNILRFHNGKSISFSKPVFYYNDSSLVVFDYDTDIQYNIDLNNQQFGIDQTNTVVFTKSIIVRDSPIQNFGAKQFLNVPYKNKYNLIELYKGTQNVVYVQGYYAVEHLWNKKSIKYTLTSGGHNTFIELDYLPHFTVKNNLIFVPENGHIDVYKDNQVISKLDCPICTRDSKLYSTNSGIMLLENNTLYLLNTK